MHDRKMQRHVPCLPACHCILRVHRGLDTVRIFGNQIGIFAQNLSNVTGTVTKESWREGTMCARDRASHCLYSYFFWGRQQEHFYFFISKRYVLSKKKMSVHPLLSIAVLSVCTMLCMVSMNFGVLFIWFQQLCQEIASCAQIWMWWRNAKDEINV